MNLIQIENVSKNFGEFKAVDNVSFNIEKGSVYGLLGPNGAGKTTTIRMVMDQGHTAIEYQTPWCHSIKVYNRHKHGNLH